MRQPHYYMGLYSYILLSAGLTIGTQVAKMIRKKTQKCGKHLGGSIEDGRNEERRRACKAAGVDVPNRCTA